MEHSAVLLTCIQIPHAGIILGWTRSILRKNYSCFAKMDFIFAGPHIQAIQISCQLCSNVDIKDSWAHQILQRAHENFKWPIKIWKFACI